MRRNVPALSYVCMKRLSSPLFVQVTAVPTGISNDRRLEGERRWLRYGPPSGVERPPDALTAEPCIMRSRVASPVVVGKARRAAGRLAVVLLSPQANALWLLGIASRVPPQLAPLVRARLARRYGLFVSARATIGSDLRLPHPNGIVIGDGVQLGTSVTLYQQVTIGGRALGEGGYATVGDGVVVFAGAKIIGAVNIGNGAVIGANAVVLSDVPPHTTVVGIPARPTQESTGARPIQAALGCVDDHRTHPAKG